LLFELDHHNVSWSGTGPLFRLKERKTPSEVGLTAHYSNSVMSPQPCRLK